MTRRALSPAAHGVLLAVRAALRGRVPQITDAADGTTTAVVLDPDGTRILRCEVRSTSRARDTRQPLLPLAPGAPHTPPAPVAVVSDRAALDEIKAAAQRAEAPAPQDDDGPAPINGVCVGDKIFLDDELVEVLGVDEQGFVWRTVALDAGGHPFDEGDVLWREVADAGPGRWRVTEVQAHASREAPLRPAKVDTPTKPKAAPKPKPARLTAVPEADELAIHGETVIVWQPDEGDAWDLVWSEKGHGGFRKVDAWAKACEGHRAREYNRGKKCVRDSADGAS